MWILYNDIGILVCLISTQGTSLPPTSLQNSTSMWTMWAYFSSVRPQSACPYAQSAYYTPPTDMLLMLLQIFRFLPGILVLTCCFKNIQVYLYSLLFQCHKIFAMHTWLQPIALELECIMSNNTLWEEKWRVCLSS